MDPEIDLPSTEILYHIWNKTKKNVAVHFEEKNFWETSRFDRTNHIVLRLLLSARFEFLIKKSETEPNETKKQKSCQIV